VHLEAHAAFTQIACTLANDRALAVASPDPGGVKRAQLWREALESLLHKPVGFAMVDKRCSAGLVSSENLVAGDVDGTTVLLLDDLIASVPHFRLAQGALATSKLSVVSAAPLFATAIRRCHPTRAL
jgi:ribose-phosphate pyrophosphokinase